MKYSFNKFDSFNSSILNLGDIDKKTEKTEALCCIFDLEGFTKFVNSTKSNLMIPRFINYYLNWLFKIIKTISIVRDDKSVFDVDLYINLPFYAKYMGDGVMFLWYIKDPADPASFTDYDMRIANIIDMLNDICNGYDAEFYPEIVRKYPNAPKKMRCGIAKGPVYSIGNGKDYVGEAINLAARLQKHNNYKFCFSGRGLKTNLHINKKDYVKTKGTIRSFDKKEEIIYVRKEEHGKK